MREPVKVGVVGVSLAAIFGVLGRAGVSLALDDPAPWNVSIIDRPESPQNTASPTIVANASNADFGPPPTVLARTNSFASVRPYSREPSDAVRPPGDVPFERERYGSTSQAAREHADALIATRKQERLAALAAEVATLASDAELDRLIGELETTVAEKRAEAELRQARAALERVVAAFPQTVAADSARDMLGHDEPAKKLMPVEAPR